MFQQKVQPGIEDRLDDYQVLQKSCLPIPNHAPKVRGKTSLTLFVLNGSYFGNTLCANSSIPKRALSGFSLAKALVKMT
uniref:Uncharacterized protein n=1 Tax=Candidatus Kentrum sp. TC TaxID=2126339 RepID=A0A450ZRG5_9GAMM|nr:MAG: hypothetical protein BECKTC1821F_GA0114240_10105 [Candidatus Kentron sp. TC]